MILRIKITNTFPIVAPLLAIISNNLHTVLAIRSCPSRIRLTLKGYGYTKKNILSSSNRRSVNATNRPHKLRHGARKSARTLKTFKIRRRTNTEAGDDDGAQTSSELYNEALAATRSEKNMRKSGLAPVRSL